LACLSCDSSSTHTYTYNKPASAAPGIFIVAQAPTPIPPTGGEGRERGLILLTLHGSYYTAYSVPHAMEYTIFKPNWGVGWVLWGIHIMLKNETNTQEKNDTQQLIIFKIV
jgi:hypothetical protein